MPEWKRTRRPGTARGCLFVLIYTLAAVAAILLLLWAWWLMAQGDGTHLA